MEATLTGPFAPSLFETFELIEAQNRLNLVIDAKFDPIARSTYAGYFFSACLEEALCPNV